MPKPYPARLETIQTPSFGGEGGNPFSFNTNSTTFGVAQILVRSESMIDQLQLQLGDGIKSIYTEQEGGSGGTAYSWKVPNG